MAKGFTKNNPLERLSGAAAQAGLGKKEPQEPEKAAKKKRAGRPKTKDVKNTCKNINVAVPTHLLEKWESVKIVHGSNLTEYVTKLIERDMESNYERYRGIADSLKDI